MEQPRFLLTGDTSLSVEFGNEISEAINRPSGPSVWRWRPRPFPA